MKQTEIGLIPEDWELVKIEDIAEVDTDNLNSSTNPKLEIKYISLECIDEGRLSKYDEMLFEKAPSRARRILKKDDILVSTVRPNLKSHYYFQYEEDNFIGSTGFSVVRTKQNSSYVYHHFFGNILNNQIENLIVGSNYPAINNRDVKNLQIPLPPLAEQEAIANALSDADAWIEKLEQLIAKKRLIKQGAMQTLLTPKEDWEVKKLGEVIDVYRGGSPRPIQDYITSKPDGINWIKIGDTSASGKYITSANEKIIPEGEKNSRKVFVGDFLLSNSMSFGRPYILKIEGCIHDGWLVLQNYQASFNTEFLYYLLTSKYVIDQYKSKAAGSSVLNLNKELVSTVDLLIPPVSEQERIATILSDMDAEIGALEQQLGKARHIKQGMMQELLTGRVRLV